MHLRGRTDAVRPPELTLSERFLGRLTDRRVGSCALREPEADRSVVLEWTIPPAGRCVTCGEPLGADPHMIMTAPDGEHLGCRDWSRHEWPRPFAQLERRLRARATALRRALRDVEGLGRYLNERRAIWPVGAAETVVEVQRRHRALRDALERAGMRVAAG